MILELDKELKDKVKAYEKEHEQLYGKIKDLKNMLKASEDHNKIFSEKNERLKHENKELQVMISDQDKSINELREKFDIIDSERCQYFIEKW